MSLWRSWSLLPSSLVAFSSSGCHLEADREGLAKWTRETVDIAVGNEEGHRSTPMGLSLSHESESGQVRAERASPADKAIAVVWIRGLWRAQVGKGFLCQPAMPTAPPQPLLSLD